MRGTGPVGVNGSTLYAYYTQNDNSVRMRISIDDADRLGIVDGLRLRIAIPGRKAMDYLAIEANRNPPYVWLHLEPLAQVASRSTG